MVRMFAQVVDRLIITLIFCREQGYTFSSLSKMAGRGSVSRDESRILGSTDTVSSPNLNDTIQELIELRKSSAHYDEGTLIDQMVRILKMPFGRNKISGQTYQQLRKALLLPDELAKLSASTFKDMQCAECGTPFVNGLMMTYHEGAFFCISCHPPSFTRCSTKGCSKVAELPANFVQRLKKGFECGTDHSGVSTARIPVANPFSSIGVDLGTDDPSSPGWADRALREADEARRRASRTQGPSGGQSIPTPQPRRVTFTPTDNSPFFTPPLDED